MLHKCTHTDIKDTSYHTMELTTPVSEEKYLELLSAYFSYNHAHVAVGINLEKQGYRMLLHNLRCSSLILLWQFRIQG
jgi:hypothetical protein